MVIPESGRGKYPPWRKHSKISQRDQKGRGIYFLTEENSTKEDVQKKEGRLR